MITRKILHIITDLDAGGAEQMLYNLLNSMADSQYSSSVISLRDIGAVGVQIQEKGIPVFSVNMSPDGPDVKAISRLKKLIRQAQPDIVQTWMYHANLVGGLLGRFSGCSHVVWGIHHHDLSHQYNRRRTLVVARLGAVLSNVVPEKIVVCSRKALQAHADFGYSTKKMEYIPNGFDLTRFRRLSDSRKKLHIELGLDESIPLIGMAARFHPLKDHLNFIKAAAIARIAIPKVQFLLCGKDINRDNIKLVSWIQEEGLQNVIHLLDVRTDIPYIFSGLDVGTLTSKSEAFPNVVGEMMSTGLPCVVTDAGDSAEIVGETGYVVPAENPEALSDAWIKMLQLTEKERTALGYAAQERIKSKFSLIKIANEYIRLYDSLF